MGSTTVVARVSVDAHAIARQFVTMIRDEPTVRQLWLAHERDDVELFVVTEEAGRDDDLRIAEAFASLIERHPEANIRPRMFDPRRFVSEAAFRAAVPKRATQVPLHD